MNESDEDLLELEIYSPKERDRCYTNFEGLETYRLAEIVTLKKIYQFFKKENIKEFRNMLISSCDCLGDLVGPSWGYWVAIS